MTAGSRGDLLLLLVVAAVASSRPNSWLQYLVTERELQMCASILGNPASRAQKSSCKSQYRAKQMTAPASWNILANVAAPNLP